MIAKRSARFDNLQKVSWDGGSGQVVHVFPSGFLLVRGKKTQRLYHEDGVLEGRFDTNSDLTLHADLEDDLDDFV